ncbi:hypothetical protein PR202_gb05304 [Eleusine coracana subsp. coracana]|uniref:Uncharacterized protein n=1 Tax=Eleusine coracana subsp. coracana TaxID=191504 RepID=A0AAV5E6L8_ELECO|nr:hypothetical protein PR202_gb05304 [Eleusine coracana subsp. coracana]
MRTTAPSQAPSSPLPTSAPAQRPQHCAFPSPRRRDLLLLPAAALALSLAPPPAPPPAAARGLFRMPPQRLANRYYLVRAGEYMYEEMGVLHTNPVAKTSVDSGLSPAGLRQTARAALELQRIGACEDDCWIWPSITQRAYQAAEIIAAANGINRSHIVPEYSFLDARGLGAFEGKSLDTLPEVPVSSM